ncbi:hypothetical protein SLA2020_418540 [Shorea laevis]
MAQLPPKVPQNWSSCPLQRIPATLPNFINSTASPSPSLATMIGSSTNQIPPSWVDEFLDFSSIRRGAHRRSISDSIAFLDPPLDEESKAPRESNAMLPSETNIGFDRFDDEQLMSMFSDDVSLSLPPTVSSSSDQNSNNNDEKTATTLLDNQQHPKTEPGEVQSSCKPEPQRGTQPQPQPPPTSNPDSTIDPKRVKRILANRQSAQRSRVRKLQYISELERSVTTLQTEVSALSPRVAFLDHQRVILTVDNSAMKQRIAALAQDKIFKDAHQEALKKEIERLTQLMHHQQKLRKMNGAATDNQAPPQQPSSNADPVACTENDQVFN